MASTIEEALASVELIAFDFDGVFTDNTVYVSQEGVESVRCWRSDGLGLAKLTSIGVQAFIISTEVNPVVTARARKLKIGCEQGVEDKALTIAAISAALGITLDRTMFVGNDVNDIPALASVGVPVAVADSYVEILPYVMLRTEKPGGLGAVREICDRVVAARQCKANEVVTDGA